LQIDRMMKRPHRMISLALLLGLGLATSAYAADPAPDSTLAEAQRTLLVLGFNAGRTTGLVTPQSTKALEAFQQQQGLPVTGRADAATMAKLRDKRDNNPNQVLGNSKTGAPESRRAAPQAEPHPVAAGPAVSVGGNTLPDAPRDFSPVIGNPSAAARAPATPSAAPSSPSRSNGAPPPAPSSRLLGGEAPAPLAAAPQEAVAADQLDRPSGQRSGSFLERAVESAQHGPDWVHWVWAPIAGLLVILAAGAWWRAGRSRNPYLASPGSSAGSVRRREPTLER
jgi:peptidoglycan hydrolase-like protein with peptidoglycan-binding domain